MGRKNSDIDKNKFQLAKYVKEDNIFLKPCHVRQVSKFSENSHRAPLIPTEP